MSQTDIQLALNHIRTCAGHYRLMFGWPNCPKIDWTSRCRVLGDRPNVIALNFLCSLEHYCITEELRNITLKYFPQSLLTEINFFLNDIKPSLNFTHVEDLRVKHELAVLSTQNAHSTREALRYAEQIRLIEDLRQQYENRLFNVLDHEIEQFPSFREVEQMATININMNGTISEFRELLSYLSGDDKQRWIVNKLQRKINKRGWKQSLPEECAVCCEKVSQKDYLSCGHCIHKGCVILSKKTTCPCCREEVEMTKEELEQY